MNDLGRTWRPRVLALLAFLVLGPLSRALDGELCYDTEIVKICCLGDQGTVTRMTLQADQPTADPRPSVS
jgi:hypothetical protein